MSTQRLLWIFWCLGWASFWLFLAFVTLGLALIPAGLSLLAILAPVGKPRPQLPPRRDWDKERHAVG